MADTDSLSSDSDDEEYIPEGGEQSSGSDVSEGEQEVQQQRTTRNRGKQDLPPRSCRHKDKVDDDDDLVKEREKSRIDDLWASFKRDMGTKSQPTAQVAEQTAATDLPQSGQGKGSSDSSTKVIKVKQKYDFAGEEVVVEKEVAADSKEAKSFLHMQSLEKKRQPISLTTGSPQQEPLNKKTLAGTKRSSGLSSVLQSIGKKPKLSTLDKSHLDWQKYKKEKDLEEELTQHNKDGYLAKQEFLQKADLKQFELEREERLKRFRRMY